MAYIKLAAAIADAERYIAENPRINDILTPCRCDAQSCSVSCSCLPSRLNEAKVKIAKINHPQAASSISRQTTYNYTHHVDTCDCGTCYKARMDSGTQKAYEKARKDTTK